MKKIKVDLTDTAVVKYPFFTVAKHLKTGLYLYCLNHIWTKNHGDFIIRKSKSKSWLLNKLTLAVFGFIYTIFYYLVWQPMSIPFFIVYNYYDGAKNFFRNGMWVQNVRYFNWCNIVIIFVLTTLFIF